MTNSDVVTIHAQLLAVLNKRFPMVGREDISQELWLAYYSSEHAPEGPQKPVDGLDDNGPYEEYSKTLQAVRREMEASAKKYCRREKAALEGYELDDEVYYSVASLKLLLETWFAAGVVADAPRTHENSVSRPSKTGSYGDYMVSLIDVGAALKRLKHKHQAILWQAYAPALAGRTDEEIAAELRSHGWQGMTLAKFAGAHGRALRLLQRALGGVR